MVHYQEIGISFMIEILETYKSVKINSKYCYANI